MFLNNLKKGIIDFYDISISIEKLGLQHSSYNFSDISELKNEFLPAISYVYEKKATDNEFIVITKIDSNFIDNQGEIRNEKKAIFKKRTLTISISLKKRTHILMSQTIEQVNLH